MLNFTSVLNFFKIYPLYSKNIYFSTSKNFSLNYLIYTHLPMYNCLNGNIQPQKNKKKKITFYEKILSFYLVRLGFSFFTQRAFILLEMQLNSFLARVKIIPYFFMARDLCFYRLVLVNQKFISNPYFIISLFDTVQLPFFLYNYISYRNNRYMNLPKFFKKYFFFFWRHFTNYNFNQLWLINNYFHSHITGQVIPFEYPNILIYMSPFLRFTKIYFRNHSYSDTRRKSYFGYTNSVFKLKLFSYAQFYK